MGHEEMFRVITTTEVTGLNLNKEVSFDHLWHALTTTATSLDEMHRRQKDTKRRGFQAQKTTERTNKHKERNKSKPSKPKSGNHYLPYDKWKKMSQKEKDDFLANR